VRNLSNTATADCELQCLFGQLVGQFSAVCVPMLPITVAGIHSAASVQLN